MGTRIAEVTTKADVKTRNGERSSWGEAMARSRGRGRRGLAGEMAELDFVGQGPTGHST